MGSSKKYTVGYRYLADVLMGFSRMPCDAWRAIKIGGRDAWTGNLTDNGVINISKPNLFGGDEGGGGVVGELHVMFGASDQARNEAVVAAFGEETSALRRVNTAFFSGQLCAINPYPEPWMVQRTTILKGWQNDDAWYPERAVVIPDGLPVPAMNPAHILVKAMTLRDVGGGQPMSRLDLAGSFTAAADALHAEGFGMCLRWNTRVSVGEFLQQVCDHIAASLYVSRRTGLIQLALARGDYEVGDLPLFTFETGLLEVEEVDNSAGAGAVNEVVIEWRDPVTNETRSTGWRNTAAIAAYGRRSETIQMPGLPTAQLAARVAAREGELLGSGIKRYKLAFDRRGRDIPPAGVFKITAPQLGIGEVVLRAVKVQDGGLEDGVIRITAVQDVFGMDSTTYVGVQESTHVIPDRSAAPAVERALLEANWRELAARLSAQDLAALDEDSCAMLAVAARPTPLSFNYTLIARVGSNPFEPVGTGNWCPTAVLDASVGAAPEAVAIVGGMDLNTVEVGEAALLGSEWCRVAALDPVAGTAELARGCADTPPRPWPAGTRIWFTDAGALPVEQEYLSETVNAKFLTRTSADVLDESLASIDSITLANRQAKPYAPGRLRLNGQAYPAALEAEALLIEWAHRNRNEQADQLIDEAVGSVTPEAGTTYTVVVEQPPGTVFATQTGITGTAAAPVAPASGTVRVSVTAHRDGLQSWSSARHDFAWDYIAPTFEERMPSAFSQSSVYGSLTATTTNMRDGDGASGAGTASTGWIEADLGAPAAVSRVIIAGGNMPGWGGVAAYLNDATLQYYDGADWITVLTISGVTDSGGSREKAFDFSEIVARRWRLYRTTYLATTEFRLFGAV